MESHSEKSQRIVKNTTLLYGRMAFTMLLGIYTSRVVLHALGISDYGIYTVVGGVGTMFLFLNGSMSVATSRFISFELGRKNVQKLSLVYNQARIIHWILATFVFLLIESAGLWFMNHNLNIPADRMTAATVVLHCTAISSVLSIIATPDQSLIIAHERMKSFAYITMMDALSRFCLTFFLLSYHHDRLILYAILMMTIQVTDRIIYLVYCHRKFEETKGKIVYDRRKFRQMLSFASWNLLGNLALMSIDQGVNILLNIFFGPVVNAARGVANTLSYYSNAFITNIRMAVNPQITKSYAGNDMKYMEKLITFSSLSCFYVLLLFTCPLYWLADYILELWLVDVPEGTALFAILTMFYMMVNSFSNPVIIGIHATGNIKKFQIVEGILMSLTLPLAYLFLKLGFPPYTVYIAQILGALITQIGRLYIILPNLNIRWSRYLSAVIIPILKVLGVTTLVSMVLLPVRQCFPTLLYHMTQAICTTTACIIAILQVGMQNDFRHQVINFIKKALNR